MIATKAYAAFKKGEILEPHTIQRREVGPNDVLISIDYCGICHSDIHTVNGDWGEVPYPLVPGHEIIGRVQKLGDGVQKFQLGERVGVGCLVDSCRKCTSCEHNQEQFCPESTFTYASVDRKSGGFSQGGYSQSIVVDENCVLKVSEKLDAARAAPLLCAGITTYSPLVRAGFKPNDRVGIVGMGGLGHIAIKLAKAMGAEVIAITHSQNKVSQALDLGANSVLLSTDTEDMQKHEGSFDYILNTIPVRHDVNPYLKLLKPNQAMTLVGTVGLDLSFAATNLVLANRRLEGSLIGGIRETQEMLDFCAEKGVVCDVEVIKASDINEAYQRVKKSQVFYRCVIDTTSL